MKQLTTNLLLAFCLINATALGQSPLDSPLDAATIADDAAPGLDGGLPDLPPPPPAPPLGEDTAAGAVPDLPPPPPPVGSTDDGPGVDPTTPPSEEVVATTEDQPILESDEGYLIKDAALNDIFQFLAKQAGRQYFHNTKIATPEFRVTGHLNDGDPLQQMEELAFMYGLMLYTKGNTVYALSASQMSQLPSSEFTYQLRYLRPTDMEQIKDLIKPVLSPGTGIVNFEPKTNTVIIIDTAHRIDQARNLLEKIDRPKGQIIVETKILRVNSSAAERTGINWSASLGETGTTIEIARSLNAMFGVADQFTDIANGASAIKYDFDPSANLVLSPVQLQGVLRALAEGNTTTQVSNPTLITEDNEQGTISIIDRVPIITTTTNQGTGDVSSVSEEVRYKIDESDTTINEDPEKHREIGISMVVTPTLLPDGTVRMRLRPRSAQIVEEVKSAQTGNVYPRVTESMIESMSRVPDGYSLVIGGFYGEVDRKGGTKVPLFGDIPVLNFFFKSKETVKEQASLVFIVTPTSYDPSNRSSTGIQSNRVHSDLLLTRDHNWVDPNNPGPAHEPNFRRGIRGLKPEEAPYYPTQEELNRSTPTPVSESTYTDDSPRFSRARRR
jgi:type II secretory pathway component GspD/PulD (secretin)